MLSIGIKGKLNFYPVRNNERNDPNKSLNGLNVEMIGLHRE